MITLSQQVVLAQEQRFEFYKVIVSKHPSNNKLKAEVHFKITGENGQDLGRKILTYDDVNFDTFWTKFNSGKYLYEELATNVGIDPATVDVKVEDEFVNAKIGLAVTPVEEPIIEDLGK